MSPPLESDLKMFTHMSVLGYVPRVCNASSRTYSIKLEPIGIQIYNKYKRQCDLPLLTNYAFSKANFRATFNGTKKYDKPDFFVNIDSAVDDVCDLLSDFKNKVPVISLPDVNINPEGACGYIARHFLDCHDKFDVIERHYDYLVWYVNNCERLGITPLWDQCAKEEVLPMEKILKNDLRVFTVSPIGHLVYTGMFCQAFNQMMSNHANMFMSSVGTVFQYGGFHDIMSRLDSFAKKSIGDVSKYDSSLLSCLMYGCKAVRYYCWDKNGDPLKFIRAMDYIYHHTVYSVLILPNGLVVVKKVGNPSGSFNTTYDNTICHMFIRCLEFRFYFSNSIVNAYRAKEILLELYSDDNIDGTTKWVLTFKQHYDFYMKFNILYKEEAYQCQDSVVGLTFLGAKCIKVGSDFVPLYDVEKCIYGLLSVKNRKFDPDVQLDRISATMMLLAFADPKVRVFLDAYFDEIKTQFSLNRSAPSVEDCKSLWVRMKKENC